ncbi:pre-mRNA cleavage complex 2 protein Pcf11 [Trichomycterus rosablanca]|uniref:pre-mRNA cleavage complex 2 protein Pcf11 n=1 Tax=Trichomycterus rosablanca TaxID=2290929 RepID=UPI002F35FD67
MSAEAAAREDACREYQSSLEDLTFNSKPHINMLTILAEENLQFSKDIVAIIEAQIAKAPPAEKLPVMYLVDSIVKNVGRQYLDVFTKNLVSSFICVFEKVDENTRKCLYKLRSTWDEIFPLKKLYALDCRVNGVDPAWPIKPLPPSIHVNPKFLKQTEDLPPRPAAPEKSIAEEQVIRQQLLAKQKQLLELQQKKIELELEQTKAQLVASTTHPPVSAQGKFAPAPAVQPVPTPPAKSWLPSQAEKPPTRDPRLNRSPAMSVNTKEHGNYKKESQGAPIVATDKKGPPPAERPAKLMRIPKKDSSSTEEKNKPKSVSPLSRISLHKSKDVEPEHTVPSDITKKDPRLRKQVPEKTDTKEEEVKEKKKSFEKKEREEFSKSSDQQKSSSFRSKSLNGSLSKHDRFGSFQKPDIKISKANIRKRSRSRSRSPPVHSPKRKDRRSPKRRTRSITPPSKPGKGRQLSKHSEDLAPASGIKEERNAPKKSISELRRLKRPLEERTSEHRDAPPPRASPVDQRSTKDVKKWKSGWEPTKQPEPDLSHSKPGPQRHKTWSNYQRPPTPRTPKQHRLSVDANLQIPDELNSASKRDLLRKASQRLSNGEISQDEFLSFAHKIRQLFQYQDEKQHSDSWEESNDGTYIRKKPHGQMSDAELSYHNHKSQLIRTQLQRPVHHISPLRENMQHHRPQQDQDHFGETSDGHRRGTDVHKLFPMPDDPRRLDKATSRMGPPFRNSSSPVNCDRNSPHMDVDQPDEGDISPRFESPNSVHSGTGPDHDEPASLDTVQHEIISGPGRGKRDLTDSPGHTPPHSSEEPGIQMSMQKHDRTNMAPQFDGNMRSHGPHEGPHEGPQDHIGQPRIDGLSVPPQGRFESPVGHGHPRYDEPGWFDGRGPQRFERSPLLKNPVRFENQPMPHGPLRYSEPRGGGRFDGPASGHFDGPVGHQGPQRFDCPGPMRFNNPASQNRFDSPARFDDPHMAPVLNNPAGFEGPMLYPTGMANYDGPMRLEGPGGQGQGMIRFDNPAQPGPMRFEAQPPGIPRFDSPRYCGPQNIQNSFRPQGQMLIDHPQGQGAMINQGVPPSGFNMNPSNAFDNQPQQFHMQQNVPQAPNFNMSDPAGFQNSYRPVQFPGAPAANPAPPMGVMNAPVQNFIPSNPGTFNPPSTQFIQPESHLGQMDVNDLMAKLIGSGIIKPTQSDSGYESTVGTQSQSQPEDEPDEEEEQAEDENLPDMTSFLYDMKQRHESVIVKLYTGIQCYSCGMRFTASQTDIYADHLDWHYRQNRSEKDISRKVTHRRWYYSLTDWIEFEEIADLEERAKSHFFEKVHEEVVQKTQEAAKEKEFQSVKAAPDVVKEFCEICQEQFEQYWEDNEEEWHLKNAIRVDGNTYHPSCYEDYKNTSSFVDATPSPNKMLTENPLNAFIKQEREGEDSCSSIKEEPAEEATGAVTVKQEVQDDTEGELKPSAIPF